MTRLSIAFLIALTATARADDAADATRKLLDEQVRAINAGDAKAFAATFVDENAFAFLPAAADEGSDKGGIEAAAKHWLASVGKVTVKLEQLHLPKEQMVGVGSWFDGELAGGTTRWRISGIVIHSRITKYDTVEEGPFKVAALHISEAADDKAVLTAAADGKLPALPKSFSAGTADDENPASIASFAKHVLDNPAVSLIGSAAKEHVVGRAAVAKTLAGWKSLKLASTGFRTGKDEDAMWGFEWAIGHVEATFTVKGKPVKVPYRALLIVSTPSAPGADHGAAVELISAHYSVALH